MIRTLIDCGVNPTQARAFAEPVELAMQRFHIVSLRQRAAFLAQCMHESANFTRLEEGLWYRSPERIAAAFARLRGLPQAELQRLSRNPQGLAKAAYGTRNGNRGSNTDDGWNYRGSGIIQLTGLTNFERAQHDTGRPYVSQPDLVRNNPADAALTAGLYWEWTDCNHIIDEDDFDGVSRVINLGSRKARGVPNGLQDRRDLYDHVTAALALE